MPHTMIVILALACCSFTVGAKDYYLDIRGNDDNTGTSAKNAWKSLAKISGQKFKPGDHIILKSPHTYKGELLLKMQKGTKDNPIVISSSDNSSPATIDCSGMLNGISLLNSSFITVKDLTITGNGGGIPKDVPNRQKMRCAILVKTTWGKEYSGITLQNLTIKDIYFNNEGYKRGEGEVLTANGTEPYGWGIRFINQSKTAILKDLVVNNCLLEDVAHTAIKFSGRNKNIQNIRVSNNTILKSGGPGMQLSNVRKGLFKGNTVDQSGSYDDSRKWGRGSGMWTWSSENILIEHNSFTNANGPADSAGAHIDFNCSDVIIQYNFSARNAGGFCEILGNNSNCSYRYNISVNDGWREEKKGINPSSGKTIWLSGFVGKKKKMHGPYNNYIYNNTIYVDKDQAATFVFFPRAKGAVIANNIFYIKGTINLRETYKNKWARKKAGPDEQNMKNMIFKNNLFLSTKKWPSNAVLRDLAPLQGNPKFVNEGGMSIKDYIPRNSSLIKNKGIPIKKIPDDEKGLSLGLEVTNDIMGTPIKGRPDLGAIELE